jgi:beta-lactamase class A
MKPLLSLLRRLCLAALLGAAATAWAGPPELRAAQDAGFQRGLERVVQQLGLNDEVAAGRLSLALVDVSRGAEPRLAMLNGDRMMYAASMPKLAILLGAFVEAEAGRLALDAEHLQAMTNMIRRSSNEDATRVLHWVGGERLIDILESARFRFYEPGGAGGLWVGKAYDGAPAYHRDPVRNLSHGATAFQVARLYYLLENGALFGPALTAQMKEVLSKPGIQHKFVKGLEERPGVEIFRKSGTWRDTHADSALVEYGDRRYVMVGIAEHPQGGEWLRRLAAPLHDLVVAPVQEARLAP